jgi:hypothetical protein
LSKNKKPAELKASAGSNSLSVTLAQPNTPARAVRVMVVVMMSQMNHKFTISENVKRCQNKFVQGLRGERFTFSSL